ncbi:hypothetical protein ATJ97_3737 [Georgenia soli]|uniref:Uncharacterized protein n=1 Tax=Georgenia soli TaxID=638953 RepID=A0A2A9ESL3_9MICO|nr:hypothetical protein [Georgenia soli]PFG41189.1 hypothetical protein ATJ97_3737 [Georgenia soli]
MSHPGGLLRWVGLCAAAEAVGMTAAATAARVGASLAHGPTGAAGAWGVVVLGGLVEGTAIGLAQAAALRPLVRGLRVGRFVAVTVAVAGLGWAAASAPSVLATDDGAAGPPLAVVLGGAAGLGLVMGAVLGTAQAAVLRPTTAPVDQRGAATAVRPGAATASGPLTAQARDVARPWRWVGVSAAAWTPAMVVVFAGAQAAPASWPTGSVALLGTATGALAGAVLGAVCGALAPLLHAGT